MAKKNKNKLERWTPSAQTFSNSNVSQSSGTTQQSSNTSNNTDLKINYKKVTSTRGQEQKKQTSASKSKSKSSDSPLLSAAKRFLSANDDAAEMTYGVYNPKAKDRSTVGNVIAAGGRGWRAGQRNALAAILDPTDDGSATDAEMMFYTPGAKQTLSELENNPVANYLKQQRGKATKKLSESADRLSAEAQEAEETAKKGKGKVTRLLIDAGIAGTQLALDVGVGAATGTGTLSMGTRTFGQSYKEATGAGANQQQAFNYAASAAGVEMLTEKIFDVAKLFGGGSADDLVEKAVGKWAKTNAGRNALRNFFAAVTEGGEEVASDLVNPIIREFYQSGAAKEAFFTKEGLKNLASDAGRDALIGAMLGGLGNVANVGNNTTKNNLIDLQNAQQAARAEAQRMAEYNQRQQRQRDYFAGNTMQTGTADAEATNILNRNARARGEVTPAMIAEVVKATPDPARAMQNLQAMQTRQAEQNAVQATPADSNGIQELEIVKQAIGRNPTFDDLVNYYSQQGETGFQSYQRIADAFERGELVDGGNSGIYTRAEIEQRQTSMPEADHIDNRTPEYNSKVSTKPFQLTHPELHPYFAEAAKALQQEAVNSFMSDMPSLKGGKNYYISRGLRKVMDMTGLSRQQISQCCQDIIDNHGAEDYASAKHVEAALDYIMTNGAQFQNAHFDSNPAYLEAKGKITGGTDPNTFDYALEHEYGNLIAMNEMTVDEARADWEKNHPQQTQNTVTAESSVPQRNGLPEGQGAMSPTFPYREAQTQTHSSDPLYSEVEREMEGLRPEDRTHKVNSDAEVDRNADERFEFDYEGEKADLFGDKPEWDDADTVLAHKIIEAEIEKARKTGDYSEVVRLQKEYDARGTEQGQALRQRGRFAHSATDIVAEAATLLDEIKGDLPRKMKRAELLEDIKQDADALERARSEGKPVDESNRELIDLIKRLSGKRKTGGFAFGLVMPSKVMKTTSWALEKVAKQEGGNAFLAAIAESQLRSRAADYKPTSPLEVIKTLRYLGMLSKISTIARNLEGNAGFDLVESYSEDTGGQFADVLMSLFTGRRALPFDRSWASKAKRKGSGAAGLRAYLETALDADVSGTRGKYETKAGGRTAKAVKSPIARFMSNLEKWSGYMLTVPDEFAKGGTRAEHQRGIDALKAKGKLEANALENSADEAALQRTFQNESRTANMLSGLRRLADENIAIHDKAGGSYGVGTLITPFAQVPANLGEQFLNYSPLGLIKSTAQVAKVIKNRKSVTPEQQQAAARAFGRGVTGTEFVALAMYLASKGIIHIAGLLDDDDDEKDLSKIRQTEGVTGVQINTSALDRMLRGEDTAWQNGDNLQSIGHLQPLNGQIAMGALLAEDWAENNAITSRDIKNANLEAVLETYKDLPSFSSISNIINNYQYSTAEKVGEKMTEAGERFIADSVASFVPNWVSGIAQGMDEGRVRETYTSDREGLAGIVENTANTIQSKIPIAREQLPVALDNFGQERKTTASPFMNWLNSNILPGSITKYQTDRVKTELERLMESGADVSIPNRSPEKKVDTENGEKKLTYAEKRAYQKAYGGETFKGLNELFQSSAYKSLTNDEKAEAEKNVVSFATAKAKQKVGGKAEDPSWVTKSDGTMAQNAVYNAQYKTARNTAKQATGKDSPSDGEVLISLSNRGLDYDTTVKIMAQFMEPNTIKKYETAYADGYDFGLSAAFSGAYYEKSYDFGTTDAGNPKQRGKDNTIAWAQENLGLTRSQAIMLYNYLIKR